MENEIGGGVELRTRIWRSWGWGRRWGPREACLPRGVTHEGRGEGGNPVQSVRLNFATFDHTIPAHGIRLPLNWIVPCTGPNHRPIYLTGVVHLIQHPLKVHHIASHSTLLHLHWNRFIMLSDISLKNKN